jgi:hypothetical protein
MEVDLTQKIISTRQKLEEIAKLTGQLDKYRDELITFLRINCFDTCANFESKEDYFPGNYNDTAFTKYYKHCKICSKYEEIKQENHSWR